MIIRSRAWLRSKDLAIPTRLVCLSPQRWLSILSENTQEAANNDSSVQSQPRVSSPDAEPTSLERIPSLLKRILTAEPLAKHEDVSLWHLCRKRYLTNDTLDSDTYDMFSKTLDNYLPHHEDYNPYDYRLHLGMHQVYFPIVMPSDDLLPDGTDRRFLPGDPSLWKRRLWAGGSLSYNVQKPFAVPERRRFHQLENVTDIRIMGKDSPDRVFVTVRKRIAGVPEDLKDNESLTTQFLKQADSVLNENYTLCFLKGKLKPWSDRTSPFRPPAVTPMFTHTLTPDSTLLFRFSAMTFNAHKIHIDPNSARDDYNLKNMVVHGPLTQVLMAEFLRRSLQKLKSTTEAAEAGLRPFIRSMTYNNLRPLYVDEPLTICAKIILGKDEDKVSSPDKAAASTWRVWIQTGEGENARLAVKAELGVDFFADTLVSSSGKFDLQARQAFRRPDFLTTDHAPDKVVDS